MHYNITILWITVLSVCLQVPLNIDNLKLALEDKATANIDEQSGGTGANCLIMASSKMQSLDVVQLLIAYGANLDLTRTDLHDRTALYQTVYYSTDNNFPIVKLLLKAGANKDLRESQSNLNAAEFARARGKRQMEAFINNFEGMYEDHIER